MAYELWGPLSDFENCLGLCGLWGSQPVIDPVKTTLDFGFELCPDTPAKENDSGDAKEVVFDGTVTRPASAPVAIQEEVNLSIDLTCFVNWACSLSDDHFTNLCLWAAAHQGSQEILDYIL